MRDTKYTIEELRKQRPKLQYLDFEGFYIKYKDKKSNHYTKSKLITASKDNDTLKADILARLVLWEYMDLFERRQLAEDYVSYNLAELRCPSIQFGLLPSSESNHGTYLPDLMKLNIKTLLSDNPASMLLTSLHEITHHAQEISKHSKKKANFVGNIYESTAALEELPEIRENEDLQYALYILSGCEHDAYYTSLGELQSLIIDISKLQPEEKYQELLVKLTSYLEDEKEEFFESTCRGFQDLILKPKVLQNLKEVIKNYNQYILDTIPNNDYTHIEILTHLEGQRFLDNFDSHTHWIQKMLKHSNPSACHLINYFAYEHSRKQVESVAKSFKETFGKTNTVPLMLKFLSHLEEDEIISACELALGKDETALQFETTKKVLNTKYKEQANIVKKSKYSPNKIDEGTTGKYLNYLYPISLTYFMREFAPEYSKRYEAESLKASQNKPLIDLLIAKEKVKESAEIFNQCDLNGAFEFSMEK
ncbi:MAG: hypothetical protein IJA61_03355 [Clostridia bacterium]|nr:hypothetical protein [Clostridia bacterium]